MLRLHVFLKIPPKGKFSLGTRNMFFSFRDGKILSLILSSFFSPQELSRERMYDKYDFHIIDLYSYLELENLIISMGIFKETINPPSFHNVIITTIFYALKKKCVYLSLYGCPQAFSSCSKQGLLSRRSIQASHCSGFSCCRAWTPGC